MILVVDDDPHVSHFLADALAGDGYDVVRAGDGVEAYEHVRRADCRLMLLDIQMPRINGIELLLAMTHDGIKVPTIVMTGLQEVEENVVKQFPGVVSFLRKPFTFTELEEQVWRMLGCAEDRKQAE